MIWRVDYHEYKSGRGKDRFSGQLYADQKPCSRLRAAWLVLIGKADAVVWE